MSVMKSNKVRNKELMVDETKGRVLVSVSLSARYGRERTIRITASDVRSWLAEDNGIKAGELVSGTAIHNNMSRRLGAHRTADDLNTVFVFELVQEEVKVVKPKATPKPKPAAKPAVKKTRPSVAKKPQAAKSTPAQTTEKKPTVSSKPTTSRRTKRTTVKKGDNK